MYRWGGLWLYWNIPMSRCLPRNFPWCTFLYLMTWKKSWQQIKTNKNIFKHDKRIQVVWCCWVLWKAVSLQSNQMLSTAYDFSSLVGSQEVSETLSLPFSVKHDPKLNHRTMNKIIEKADCPGQISIPCKSWNLNNVRNIESENSTFSQNPQRELMCPWLIANANTKGRMQISPNTGDMLPRVRTSRNNTFTVLEKCNLILDNNSLQVRRVGPG